MAQQAVSILAKIKRTLIISITSILNGAGAHRDALRGKEIDSPERKKREE